MLFFILAFSILIKYITKPLNCIRNGRLKLRWISSSQLLIFSRRFPSIISIRWYPPPYGCYKLHFVGLVIATSAATQVIIRNSQSNLIIVQTYHFDQTSALIAES